jgi:hypothetical protein
MQYLELKSLNGAACTGPQLASVVGAISELLPVVAWFASDVRAVGRWSLGAQGPNPVRLPARELVFELRNLSQLEAGVFLAVPAIGNEPRFREAGVWTEDPLGSELGDAVAEVRAFDTSWIDVTLRLPLTATSLVSRLPALFEVTMRQL